MLPYPIIGAYHGGECAVPTATPLFGTRERSESKTGMGKIILPLERRQLVKKFGLEELIGECQFNAGRKELH